MRVGSIAGGQRDHPPVAAGGRRVVPALSLDQAAAFELLGEPCWLLAIDTGQVHWANAAALAFWAVAGVDDLHLALLPDRPRASRRTARYRRLFAEAEDGDDQWTLDRDGRALTVTCRVRPVRLLGHGPAMLVRVLPEARSRLGDVQVEAANRLRASEASLREVIEKLLESEQRFRDFAEVASDWYWEQDENLRFTYLSPGNHRLSGNRPETSYGKTRREVQLLDVSDEQWAAHDAALAARQPFADFRFSRTDPQGRKRYLTISGRPVFEDGVFKGYRGTGRDITALAEAEHSLRQMIDGVPAVINLTDGDDRYVRANAYFARLCGEAPEAVVGKSLGAYSGSAAVERASAMNRQVMATGAPVGPYEAPYRRHDGAERDYLVQKVAMRDAIGQVTGVLTVGMEITALKQAQKELIAAQARLQQSEQRFRDFAETASDWFWELDGDLRFSFISPQAQLRTGEDPSGLIGCKPAREGLGGVTEDAWRAHLADLDARRPVVDFRFAKPTPDGRLRHFSVGAKPVFDEHGLFQGYRGTGRDLTVQVEAERFLRQVVDSLPAVIAVRDSEMRYLLVNESYAQQIGATPEAVVGKATGTYFGPERAAQVTARDRQVIESGVPFGPFEMPMVNAEGEFRQWLLQKVPLRSTGDKVSAVLTVGMDITALKQAQAELLVAQEKLRASERRARDFAEISSHVTWELGPDLRTIYISDSIEAITGFPPSYYVGKRSIELDPDDPDRRAVEDLLEQHRPVRDFPCSRPARDGRMVHMMFSAKPVIVENDGFLGYRGTIRDVTAQRMAEMESERMRAARDVAAAGDRAKTRFLSNMSHELRTPLNAILGFSEIMGAEMFGPLGARQYVDYIADIRKCGQHLMDIIGKLLDMTRVQLDDFQLKLDKTSLSRLIDEGVAAARGAAQTECAPVTGLPIDPAWQVDVDASAMRQVFANLLSNALKFTPPSGRITVDLRPAAGGALAISISDTGCGISPARLKTIFEPFQDGSGLQARKGNGAGLGLWVSRALCGLHEGTLTVESPEGRGTVATLTLPAERVVGRPAAASKAAC